MEEEDEEEEKEKEEGEELKAKLKEKVGGFFNKIKGVVGKGIEKGKELVQMAKDRKAKALETRKAKREEFAKKVGGMFGNIKSAFLGDKKVSAGAGLQSYAGYESGAPQTAMIPMPPQIIPVDQGGESDSSGGGSTGGAEDPFESLYVGGLV